MDDHYLRTDDQLRAFLSIAFNCDDSTFRSRSRWFIGRQEEIDPGNIAWLRGEILKILRDNSTSIEERLFEYTDNNFKEGPQTAWDFWAYIWETVTNGEPWPADLPVINPDRFAYLRTDPDE